MNRTLKAMAALMLMMAFTAGCTKPEEPNNGGNNNNQNDTIVNPNNGGGNNGNNDSDVRVTTYTPQDITATTAKCGGDVIVIQGLSLTEIGLCWSKEHNPTADYTHLSSTNWNEPFVCTMINLDRNTQYFVRAYALRGLEYYYGEEKSFTTLESGGEWDGLDGALPGVFSVSETQKVRFSQGNLQYQASTNTWRFANHQWDFVGTQTPDIYGNVGGTIIGSDNGCVSSDYDGWIDLYGWGTSGYDHGAICYKPWDTIQQNNYYDAYGNWENNLDEQTGLADWGYNVISNGGNTANIWHTMSADEWVYLFDNRSTISNIRWAKAKVNNIIGIILLPDDWIGDVYILNNTNDYTADFSSNIISNSQWITLENSGAVFLPAAGSRKSGAINAVGYTGLYWSTTHSPVVGRACCVGFYDNDENTFYSNRMCPKNLGNSVRLVYPIE